MFGRGTHGGWEYKCVYECMSVCVYKGKKKDGNRQQHWAKQGGKRELREGEVEEEEPIEWL